VTYVIIARLYPESAKPRMLAIISSAWAIPGLIGPALSGFAAEHVGWRWVFAAIVPLVPLALFLTLPRVTPLNRAPDGPADWSFVRNSLLLTGGALLIFIASSLNQPPFTYVLFAAGGVVAVVAIWRLVPPGTFRAAPGLPASVLVMGITCLTFFGVDSYIPLGLTAGRGMSVTFAGIALTTGTLGWTAGAWVQDWLAPRTTRPRIVALGLLFLALGSFGQLLSLSPSVPVALAPLSWTLGGIGIGIAYSSLTLIGISGSAGGQEGKASASLQQASVLGVAAGTGFGGGLVALSTSSTGSPVEGIALQFIVMELLMVLGIALTRRITPVPAGVE
jgi:predicted MFS family arabinose efflux permease